jgi:hypothetical protein
MQGVRVMNGMVGDSTMRLTVERWRGSIAADQDHTTPRPG